MFTWLLKILHALGLIKIKETGITLYDDYLLLHYK